ncbi:uncharacterized protein PG986_006676 [Apiospora aurea]|uniref:O-methyltransferase C-terminal domain-containing protein n=1 Tax=Apiospora aurea TaxID=335848 RepID=A0ABR1QAE0_9PEZI
MTSTARIIALSQLIASETAKMDSSLGSRNLPTPSLDEDALQTIPIPDELTDIKAARLAVIEACPELKDLMTGPKELLRFKWTDYASVKAVLRLKLDKSFYVGQSTSFEAMSGFSGLKVMNVRRIVRHAIINHHFFKEDTSGVVTHSALTAALAGSESMRNSLIVELDEFWPAAVKMADAMEKWPDSEENNETGLSLANSSNKSMFDIFAEEPARGEPFGRYFSQDKTADGLLENYPWADKTTMADVGGSHGSAAIRIAERFPHMRCYVQDLRDTVAEGAARLPAGLQDRVIFEEHDFFTDQTITADVYCFKSIFHNWADKYSSHPYARSQEGGKNHNPRAYLARAGKPDHGRCSPSHVSAASYDEPSKVQQADNINNRNLDVGMLQLLNAQQREMHEWPELFRRAHPGYRYLGARQPAGAIRWIVEADWQGPE